VTDEVGDAALPRSRAALDQTRRLLDQLPQHESSPQDFRDSIGWLLDRLDNVWRTIDSESKGRRSHAFGEWWAGQKSGNRHAIKALRNAEVKQGQQTTRGELTFRMPGLIRVNDDGTVTLLDEDGNEVSRAPVGSLVPAAPAVLHSSRWVFAVPNLEDRTVLENLEIVYRRLADEVLPTAERLLLP
jgi:hypothetical protein